MNCRVDKKCARRGQSQVIIVSDRDCASVEYIANERRWASPDVYFGRFTIERLGRIEAVVVDMWEPFVNSVRTQLESADDKIVFDRFHDMGYLNKTADSVCKWENRFLVDEGDKTLSGSEYLGLFGAENVPSKH